MQLGPDGWHVPVLAENVNRFGLAAHEVESNDSGRNGLAATMVPNGFNALSIVHG